MTPFPAVAILIGANRIRSNANGFANFESDYYGRACVEP
jgi:hypothetical protein